MSEKRLSISEAKASLSAIIREIKQKGTEFTIGTGGNPEVVIKRYVKPRRLLGVFKKEIKLSDDFDVLPPDIANAFGIKK